MLWCSLKGCDYSFASIIVCCNSPSLCTEIIKLCQWITNKFAVHFNAPSYKVAENLVKTCYRLWS